MILKAISTIAWLGMINNGLAADEDILIAGQTTHESVQYYPKANLLVVAGGSGDDKIEVALAADGNVLLNGISLAKLGLTVEGIPNVAICGGGGNDILISRRLPLAVMNGGDGKDLLVWDNSDLEFERLAYGEDVLVWNAPEDSTAYGGAGLDILIGNTGGDRIATTFGGLGQDDLVGGAGWDRVWIGGWGNDWISGGTGQDGN